MKREVRGASSQRAEVVLRARDGVETSATLITTWSGKGGEALTRSVVYVASAAEQAVRRAAGAAQRERIRRARAARRRHDVRRCALRRRAARRRGRRKRRHARRQPRAGGNDRRPRPAGRALRRSLRRRPGTRGAGRTARPRRSTARRTSSSPARTQKSVDVFIALDRQGRPSAAYVIDMTEKNLLEQRVAQGEKLQAIGQLAGGLAHDFNNLLQGIILNVNKLQVRHPPGDPTFFELKSINEFASRGAELVRTLLAYRAQAGVPPGSARRRRCAVGLLRPAARHHRPAHQARHRAWPRPAARSRSTRTSSRPRSPTSAPTRATP